MIMTNTVPPPPRKRGIASQVPTPAAASENLAVPNSGIQDLNFKVSPVMHRAFKLTAASRGLSMKELFEASFRCWLEKYGSEAEQTQLPPKV